MIATIRVKWAIILRYCGQSDGHYSGIDVEFSKSLNFIFELHRILGLRLYRVDNERY